MNTKHFYFIRINRPATQIVTINMNPPQISILRWDTIEYDYQYIGMDKQLTPLFEQANVYQGNPDNMISKLVKQGYKKEEIEIHTVEINEALLKAMDRDQKIDEIFND